MDETPSMHERQARALIRHARERGPIVCEGPDQTIWIWSDLHLGNMGTIRAFDRPFEKPYEMDHVLLEAWRKEAEADDTTICLGDVSVDGCLQEHHQEWWEQAPGAKWLVLGNHDVDPANEQRQVAVQRTAVSVFAPGDPPLALTHVPLMQVPHGCVNVHGHIHNQASPTRHRHINVTVEHLRYRPARLSDIRRLARRLLEGRDVPGRNTDGTPGSGWTSLPLRCLERAATPQRRTMASMKSSIVQFDRCTTDRIESSHASAAPRVAVLKRDRKPSAAVPARVVRRSPKQSAHRLCTEYGTPMPSPMPSAKNYGPDTTMRGLRTELHAGASA